MNRIFCFLGLTCLIILNGCGEGDASRVSFAETGLEDLNGVSGNIYRVDVQAKCFELLKETVFDPRTNEGRSRHTVYWTDKTKFIKINSQKDFSGIKGPVVVDFSGFRAKDVKSLSEGKVFSANVALVMANQKEVAGLSSDGKNLVAWFRPDKGENFRSGNANVDGNDIKVSLLNRPATRVLVQEVISAQEIGSGFWKGKLEGKYDRDRFVLDRIEVSSLIDPRTVDDPALRRVLVIGDSISMNYHNAAKKALEGKANYYRNEGNAGPSDRGVLSAELWLGDYTQKGLHWDVIQFNHGLHDLKQPYDKENASWGEHQVSIEDYKKNLEKEIQILRKSGAKLIWCTTTPVPNNSTGKYARRKGEAAVYNKAAMEVICKYPEIEVNNLHKFITESKEFHEWLKGSDVHFWKRELQELIGGQVAKAVMK